MAVDSDRYKKILDTKMDRKEFLRYLGVFTAGLIGMSRFINIFQKPLDKLRSNKQPDKGGGYGSSPYGK